ncbi:group III truncated hemoglobin [Rhizobium sp. KVB221]|uniref:Group III truncated hemoglobin n=1 Tax=Rhizobium setariae TaxID=2801340 RepID=A0A936YLV0_9HYPH|nr:group III truncated hemoglobin [Rhizobium setariae]MBL0371117.1 group III truncated hemoglobin [Rhizobium setariae]
MTTRERRAEAKARRMAETGIDDAMIERLVRSFCGKVRQHPVLGPIFNERVTDWEEHMQRLMAFWSSVMLASGAYGGSPMQKHLGLPVDSRHFDMWLRLFIGTVAEICPPSAGRLFAERALRIAESLEMAIAVELGVMLAKDERLHRPDADVFLPDDA